MPQVIGDDGTPSGFNPSGPFGVWGDSGSTGPFGGGGNGVVGSSAGSSGVAGFALADSNRASGVYGRGAQVGVAGEVSGANQAPGNRVGVYGSGSNGSHLGGTGVHGVSDTARGVVGESTSGNGVFGSSSQAAGVFGLGFNGTGVLGIGTDVGVFALGGNLAGLFLGNVDITGSLFKGGGGFRIDHPLHPSERYLRHSFVESSEMKNLYDGIAACDERGEAVVHLPEWFDSLNAEFRYQLTPIGAPAPNLFIAEQVKQNRFRIGGGSAGMKVSWQITGVRKDAWAKANHLRVDEEKSAAERGRYLHPEAHGQASEQGIGRSRSPEIDEHTKGWK